MDFRLTAEEETLRHEAKIFADQVCGPGVGERDVRQEFPAACVQEAARRGYLGLLIPEAFGGGEVGNLGQCLVLEEIARVDPSTHVTISVHNSLVCAPILQWGSKDIHRRYLPKLATGELLGAYALTEPDSGSDAAGMQTTAVLDGDSWVLNGTKLWITTGATADLMIVFARTDKSVPKAKGISAFVVETSTPGVSAGKKENKTGLRASETVQVFFEDVRVPAANLLGEVNRGFAYALVTLNGGRIGIATQAVGIAQGAMEAALNHFVHATPAVGCAFSTQDVDFKLAEMATRIDAARLLVWRAAELRDRKVDHMREASMAKLFASTMCNDICRQAVGLMGVDGQTGVAERLLRDARVTEIYEGTTEIQKLVISRSLKDEVSGQ